jgi:hypothetical protein
MLWFSSGRAHTYLRVCMLIQTEEHSCTDIHNSMHIPAQSFVYVIRMRTHLSIITLNSGSIKALIWLYCGMKALLRL